MNRLIAPVGMALLSLSLAAVPFLFNATGTDLRFGSRLVSVTSAWNQIASVFLAVYQPSNAAQLLALDYGTEDRAGSTTGECSSQAEEVACLDPSDSPDETDKAFGFAARQQPPGASSELSWTERTADPKLQPVKCSKATTSGPLKRYRDRVASKSAPVPPNLPRIDVLKIIELALKNEAATKLIDKHLADYRIPAKFELTKLVTRSSMPAAYRFTTKRDASRCESDPEPAPRPDVQTREKLRKNRFVTAFELQS